VLGHFASPSERGKAPNGIPPVEKTTTSSNSAIQPRRAQHLKSFRIDAEDPFRLGDGLALAGASVAASKSKPVPIVPVLIGVIDFQSIRL
jgi:hypothetical protein